MGQSLPKFLDDLFAVVCMDFHKDVGLHLIWLL
jgi:hypothetical protein